MSVTYMMLYKGEIVMPWGATVQDFLTLFVSYSIFILCYSIWPSYSFKQIVAEPVASDSAFPIFIDSHYW